MHNSKDGDTHTPDVRVKVAPKEYASTSRKRLFQIFIFFCEAGEVEITIPSACEQAGGRNRISGREGEFFA